MPTSSVRPKAIALVLSGDGQRVYDDRLVQLRDEVVERALQEDGHHGDQQEGERDQRRQDEHDREGPDARAAGAGRQRPAERRQFALGLAAPKRKPAWARILRPRGPVASRTNARASVLFAALFTTAIS